MTALLVTPKMQSILIWIITTKYNDLIINDCSIATQKMLSVMMIITIIIIIIIIIIINMIKNMIKIW